MAIELHHLFRHALYGHSGGGGGVVKRGLVLPLHMDPRLFGERRVGHEEGLDCSPCLCFPESEVLMEDCPDLAAEELHIPLIPLPYPARRDPGVNKSPGLQQYP